MKYPEESLLKRMDVILDEVLELSKNERIPYVERVCHNDPLVLEEIKSIIKYDDLAPGFLDGNAIEFASSLLSEQTNYSFKTQIPGIENYTIEEEIDQGGMGVVYRARHNLLDRIVAIKIMKGDFESPILRHRFEQEQRVLSRLEHPHIARLYEIGITDLGQPFFVMEYIEGMDLLTYCRINKLSINERLYLFIKVAESVRFAHQNLIIHRDLKPSNILVTKDGTTKLLDFGISKLLDEEEGKVNTLTGNHFFTPRYAAPEQIKAESITTITDVYQLGVILYELLSGHLPYRVSGLSRHEIEVAICSEDPIRPSENILLNNKSSDISLIDSPDDKDPMLAAKKLRGDLDAILLKVLRKEPASRYASIESFTEDIKRFLSGRPVTAHQGSLLYRAKKFTRRNVRAVSISAAALILLIAAFATTLYQYQVAEEQSDAAEASLSFLVETINTVNPEWARDAEITAQDIINLGLDRLHDLDEQPIARASIMDALGKMSYTISNLPLADSLLRNALLIREDLKKKNPVQYAESLFVLGAVSLARGRLPEGQSLLEEAIAMQQDMLQADDPILLRTLNRLAFAHSLQGNLIEAEKLIDRVLSNEDKPLPEIQLEIAEAMDNRAVIRRNADEYAEAESLFVIVLDIRERLLGVNDMHTANTLYDLAETARSSDDFPKAERLHYEALNRYRSVFGEKHPIIANSLYTIAVLKHYGQGKIKEAEGFYLQAIEMNQNTRSEPHLEMAYPYANLARLYLDLPDTLKAIDPLRKRHEIYEVVLQKDDYRRATAKATLGSSLLAIGAFEEAEQLLNHGYELLKTQLNEQPTNEQTIRRILVYTINAQIKLASATGDQSKKGLFEQELKKLAS